MDKFINQQDETKNNFEKLKEIKVMIPEIHEKM
jgi:hypothetical protein